MIEGGIYNYAIPLGRSLAGFVLGVMLGICGGWAAAIFNAMIGLPWSIEVHRNIYFVGIALGAGMGAYLSWMNLNLGWRFSFITLALILAGATAGTYIGAWYGSVAEPNYLGQRYTIDNYIHLGAPIGGIIVATLIGLYNEIKTLGR